MTEDEFQQDSQYDLPTMSHGWPIVRGCLQSVGDGGGPILQGNSAGIGKLLGLKYVTGVQVHGGALQDPACPGVGPSLVGCLASASGRMDVTDLLPKDARVSSMPI